MAAAGRHRLLRPLTTFSTFQVQLVELGDDGHVPLAAAYLAVSVACGLVAAAAGAGLARR